MPQQINSSVSTFAAGFGTQVANLKVNEVAQAVEFLGGGEYRLFGKRKILRPFGSFDNSTSNKFTLSLIAGVGAITPLNPRDTLEIFAVLERQGCQRKPKANFIAFVSPTATFFRQFYAGLRARTWYFDSRNDDIPLSHYPPRWTLRSGKTNPLPAAVFAAAFSTGGTIPAGSEVYQHHRQLMKLAGTRVQTHSFSRRRRLARLFQRQTRQ
jgi:hypothetical protein